MEKELLYRAPALRTVFRAVCTADRRHARHGEAPGATVQQILGEVHLSGEPSISYTTVATQLKTLERRQLVAATKIRHRYYFKPIVDEAHLARQLIQRFNDEITHGDPRLVALVAEDVQRLQAAIAREGETEGLR